jgi:hypothetical protein
MKALCLFSLPKRLQETGDRVFVEIFGDVYLARRKRENGL